MAQELRIKELIMAPAVISLVITLVRLAGELMGWAPRWFSREPGGGGSPIGISWLVPIFGIYFAWKLIQMNVPRPSTLRTLGAALGGLAAFVVPMGLATALLGQQTLSLLAVVPVAALLGLFVARLGWKELYQTLLYYALAARIPVVIVMLVAILGDWGTHYDVAPSPDFPEMGALAKWFVIGLVPQLTFWVIFTVAIGMLFAVPVMALKGGGADEPPRT